MIKYGSCSKHFHFLPMQYGIELYNDYRSAFVTQFKLEETDPADMCQRMTKVPLDELELSVCL